MIVRIQQYYWNKARRTGCQVLKTRNEYAHEQNDCDSGEPGDVHLNNGLIQSCEVCHVLFGNGLFWHFAIFLVP